MSVQSEITRIMNARTSLRTKGRELGICTETDNLTQIAANFDGLTDKGTIDESVKEGESVSFEAGYYHGGTVKGISGGGNYDLQSDKIVTPTKKEQIVDNDSKYYGLDFVTVKPIPDAYQDVSNVDADAADVLTGKKIVSSNGTLIVGTIPNNGSVSRVLDTTTTSYTIDKGYHDGTGTVSISIETPSNVTPSKTSQTVNASDGKVISSITVEAIPSQYGDATNKTASAADILAGITAIGYDSESGTAINLTGTMTNNGAVAPTALAAGDSYKIPVGYHNGNGVVTTKSLLEQTTVDSGKTAVTEATMLTGYQGWVNGTKITGAMSSNGAISGTITGLGSVDGDTTYTIAAGYTTGGTVSLTSDIETQLNSI